MIIDFTAQQAFEKLGEYQVVFQNEFRPSDLKGSGISFYRREYEWLSHYETVLKKELKPWLGPFRIELFGTPNFSGIISEAIANAYCHGNKRDPSLTIEVTSYLGKKAMLIRVKDSGSGFDYRNKIGRMRSGKRYYDVAGNGLRRMYESKDLTFFYENGGAELYVSVSFRL